MFYHFFCTPICDARKDIHLNYVDMEDIYKQNIFATDPVVFIFKSVAPTVACTFSIG